MIKLLKQGTFKLAETKKSQIKLLILDDKNAYAWPNIDIGEILVTTLVDHPIDSVLSQGIYHLYQVKDEPNLVDLVHLELQTSPNTWQGYLLPTGLPTKSDIRNRIIPTKEVISK